ncbi:TetR/AcrR family transcriptional regulator [Thalassobacillus devorans]|uniref:TetR/AcrR family transcriptional regulator n=1 Tax=Thalassobacillus devorans TaxID=279813 RepID=UPI000A1C9A5D|nr:TetR/AcrR family transcriptional regulator [Thalassobacillus devorans]
MEDNRKKLKKARMWNYFMEAAVEMIEESGIENVTIRKIADRAGFTSSTAYNYFKDLSHLKFFAAMRFTKSYTEELPAYLEKGNNTLEKWLYAWECFCEHSFEQPKIYEVIFIENVGGSAQDLLDHYYDIYADDLIGLPQEIRSIITEHSFSKRSALFIQQAVEEGLIQEEKVELISDMTLMIWKGMMSTYINERRPLAKDEAVYLTLKYVREILVHAIPEVNREKVDLNIEF